MFTRGVYTERSECARSISQVLIKGGDYDKGCQG